MKQKKKQQIISNTKIAIVFFVFLAFIVGISLIFKAIAVIKASQFDGSTRFTLSITNGKNVEVMSLSPKSKDIVVFKLNNNVKPAEAGRLLKIPIDGFIEFESQDLNQRTDLLFTKAIFNYNNLKTNLTIMDLFRMTMFAKAIPENSVDIKEVGGIDDLSLDKVAERLVIDALIENDQQTIKIINGTEVGGLGGRLARFVTNMGGNVIIVATDNSTRKKSTISYIDKKTYTVGRLCKILGYEAVRESGDAISDITIAIGEDGLRNLPF